MDFDALKDLVKTITRNKVKNIEVLGNAGEESSMQEQLYDAIAKDKVNSDEEAVAFLYHADEDPKSKAYLRIKGRLERSLFNTAFFIDVNQPMFNDRLTAYFNCYRDFAAASIVLGRSARRPGIFLLEQTLVQTIKYEFVELAADIARRLRFEARGQSNSVMHEKYTKIHREYEEKRRLDMLAYDYYEDLIAYYYGKRSPDKEVHETAKKYYNELLELADKANTSQFYSNLGNIGLIQHFAGNDYQGAYDICQQYLSILKERPNSNRAALSAFSLQQLACLMQLRIFDNRADEMVAYCLTLEEEGTYNWLRIHELFVHYCFFARRYQEGLDTYQKVAAHPNFESLGGAVRDNWHLFGGYFHLLVALGQLEAETVEAVVGEFKYAKLNNEIGVLGKDKQGMNIPLVMLPLVYHLANNTFDSDKISLDALEKYRKRHLDNDMNRRSAAFMNILIAYAKRDFQSASAEKKIQKELDVLAKNQPQVAGQTFAVEIIPYEDIWEMMPK